LKSQVVFLYKLYFKLKNTEQTLARTTYVQDKEEEKINKIGPI